MPFIRDSSEKLVIVVTTKTIAPDVEPGIIPATIELTKIKLCLKFVVFLVGHRFQPDVFRVFTGYAECKMRKP